MNATLSRQQFLALWTLATAVAAFPGAWLATACHGAPPRQTSAAAQPPQDSQPAESPPASPPASAPAEHPATGAEIYQTLLKSTAFIVVSGGRGSGWIVDRKRKLVITNHHVVEQSRTAKVYFPVRESNGEEQVVGERERYVNEFTPFMGTVFLNDSRRDLAVIKLDRLPEECEAIPLADDNPQPGEPVYSVGNPGASDAVFVFATGSVRQTYRKQMTYESNQEVDAEVIESQSPINPGDSGGPVVDGEGKLVGVVAATSPKGELFTYFISVREVKALMREVDELWAPKTAEQFYRRGMQYYHRADYKQAIENFEAAIRLDSKYADAIAQRGWCYYLDEDLETAEADFEEAVALDSKCLEARLGMATIAYDREQWPEAVEQATQAIRIAPDNSRGYLLRGKAHYAQEQYRLAMADFQDARRAGGGAEASLNLGRAAFKLDDHYTCYYAYRDAIQEDPTLILAYWELANLLFELAEAEPGWYQNAWELANDAIKTATTDDEFAAAFLLRASVNLKQYSYKNAIDDFTSALRYSEYASDVAYLYDYRGWAHQKLGEYEQAEQDYRLAIVNAPDVATYHVDLARLEFDRENFIEADKACDAAANLDSDNADVHILRGMIHFAMGKPRSVVNQDVARARELDPKNYAEADVRRYVGKRVWFMNLTGEPLEVSVRFRGPSVSGRFYWYPTPPGPGQTITFTIEPTTTGKELVLSELTYQGQRVSVVELQYEFRGMVSDQQRSKTLRIGADAGYVSWSTDYWLEVLKYE